MHECMSKVRIWELSCPGFREEVSRARQCARGTLADSPHADDAALIVTELSINALLHSRQRQRCRYLPHPAGPLARHCGPVRHRHRLLRALRVAAAATDSPRPTLYAYSPKRCPDSVRIRRRHSHPRRSATPFCCRGAPQTHRIFRVNGVVTVMSRTCPEYDQEATGASTPTV